MTLTSIEIIPLILLFCLPIGGIIFRIIGKRGNTEYITMFQALANDIDNKEKELKSKEDKLK